MKKLFLMLLLLSNVIFAEDSNIRVGDDNIFFLYESRAEIQAPENNLAELISSDYRNARDEFTKYDLFEKIKPVLLKRLKEAKNTTNLIFRIGGDLGKYNFNKKAFPIGIDNQTYLSYKNGYVVKFENANIFSLMPVEIKKAKSFSSELRRDRDITIIIYAEPTTTKEEKIGYYSKKVLRVKINKIEVTLRSGASVGKRSL